jgi:hypothetical protein
MPQRILGGHSSETKAWRLSHCIVLKLNEWICHCQITCVEGTVSLVERKSQEVIDRDTVGNAAEA